ISGYALRKVRILNAAHTAMTGHGMLNGIETVGEWNGDPTRERFLQEMITEEIIPTMNLDQQALAKYSEDVLDRFRNSFVSHKLSDISLNGSTKLKSRLLPIFTDYETKNGNFPAKLSSCLLSMILFYLRNPDAIREGQDVKAWFESVANDQLALESLKLALAEWRQLGWNSDLESAYTKPGH